MNQGLYVGLTLYPFLGTLFVFLVSFAGVFIAIGRLLSKQRNHCTKIKTIDNALWKEGRPLLQSIKVCKEERDEFKKDYKEGQGELKNNCETILKKLEEMDEKQDGMNMKRERQIQKINLHMQRIDIWYAETHKKQL